MNSPCRRRTFPSSWRPSIPVSRPASADSDAHRQCSWTYKATSIGDVHHCQQTLDGTLECWGANWWGMFGDGTVNSSPTPITAAGGATYASFVALRTGTCALTSDGHAQCWGRGVDGSVGNGALQDALSPADVSGGHRFLALAASGFSDFVCGTTNTGRAYCWGYGAFGELGNDAFLNASEPVLVRLIPGS